MTDVLWKKLVDAKLGGYTDQAAANIAMEIFRDWLTSDEVVGVFADEFKKLGIPIDRGSEHHDKSPSRSGNSDQK